MGNQSAVAVARAAVAQKEAPAGAIDPAATFQAAAGLAGLDDRMV
jgi:hypothetical protein